MGTGSGLESHQPPTSLVCCGNWVSGRGDDVPSARRCYCHSQPFPRTPVPPHRRLTPSPGGARAQCGRPSLRVHGSEPVHPTVGGLLCPQGAPARGHHVSQRQLQVSVSGWVQGPSLQAEDRRGARLGTCGLTSLSPLGYSETSGGAGVTRGREPRLTEGVLAPPSYPSRPGLQVLEDFTLTLPPGKIVALVGQSGGGKRDRHPPPCGLPPVVATQWSRSAATTGPSLLEESPGTRVPSLSAPCPPTPQERPPWLPCSSASMTPRRAR